VLFRHRKDLPAPTARSPEEPEALPAQIATSSAPQTIASNGVLPGDTPEMTDEQRFLGRMAETKRALLEKSRYPLDSRPLALKTDLLEPHHVEPTMRGLTGDRSKSHGVLITQNQDRVWISPGQPAIASISAMLQGNPAGLTISRSELTPQVEDGQGVAVAGKVLGSPLFHDDGAAPDAIAGDGTFTAQILLPSGTPKGSVVLAVDAQASGEQGTLLFNFVQTDAAPATFTQSARDALESGSVAIYVGIQVQQPGLYEVVGRLYDSNGRPLVYMRFLDQLTTASTEVRLDAFGKVILDEGGVPPFVLRDVEGAQMLEGQYPDRAPMADWPAGYTTKTYALAQLSDAEYNGADKQRKLDALDQATKDGLANIHASTPPPGEPAKAH